mmetsp:Transcript_3137/g.4179  ORF Transcript_3137/g.4179 Transcript_3137/m.4179 type:complete len:791 (-) Transcript_3137:377-2749(-)
MNSLEELKQSYGDFLRSQQFTYVDRVNTAIDDYQLQTQSSSLKSSGGAIAGCPRVKINLSELRSVNPSLERRLINDPLRHLRALEFAAHEIGNEERPGYDKETRIKVAIEGPISSASTTPRSLTSSSLQTLVCVRGVATKVSSIKPKITKSVHYCPNTRQHQSRKYIDATDTQLGLPEIDISGQELPDKVITITSSVYPTKDNDSHPLETEFGLCTFKDYQTVTLQEMPESAPMGQLPRSVELILDHDLVDKIKPGDRVQIVGVYRALASNSINGQSTTSGVFNTVVLVNNISILNQSINQLKISISDVQNIRSLARREDILSVLSKSLSPSIHGHDMIKTALILQLLSGVEKNLDNGTHLRGDVNILLVGDPSTAKSQLLRSVMNIAPLAISTTGKGSSGVGLTAAVTSDPDTRERRLEAGAMVLADRGVVCIDEFDKMSEMDRVAIHEAMEQQTVTISKAGIHASLNARCSVLAAANPVYGNYDKSRRIVENIGLPDSLLSRFDLLFVVLDQLDPDLDRRIAGHVIKGHGYRSTVGRSGYDSDEDEEDDEMEALNDGQPRSIWQRSRYDNTIGTSQSSSTSSPSNSNDVLQHDFLRKYLYFAKTKIKPTLTEEARECIAIRYAEMRSRQDERTLPITARSLETVIRLASAHAKVRLSPLVEAEPDVKVAMEILGFALYHEYHQANDSTEKRSSTPDLREDRKRTRTDSNVDNSPDVAEDTTRTKQRIDPSAESVQERICREFIGSGVEFMSIEELVPDVTNRRLVEQAIQTLEEKQRIMITDGNVYRL